MNHEIMLYGIAQKEQLGFDKAVEECKYRMSRYGVTPNMLVMPPQVCPSAATTQQRPFPWLTRMLCLCTDAALHGARAGAECVATPLNAHAPPTTHGISRMRPLL